MTRCFFSGCFCALAWVGVDTHYPWWLIVALFAASFVLYVWAHDSEWVRRNPRPSETPATEGTPDVQR